MRPDQDEREVRELRLEGVWLAVAFGLLLALLAGAFQLGRMVERAGGSGASAGGEAAASERETSEAAEKVTFFDTLSGGGKEAEPSREVRATPPAATPPPAELTPGPWFVQVFVGRDRQAAEDVVRSLRDKRYPVRIDAVSEGATGSLFKVRVGGYPTKEAADLGAERLHADGHSGTWVVRLGS
jgi:cell division septation protein DedD